MGVVYLTPKSWLKYTTHGSVNIRVGQNTESNSGEKHTYVHKFKRGVRERERESVCEIEKERECV